MWHQSIPNLPQTQSTSAPILHFRLLGAADVRMGNSPCIQFGSRKAQALLFYLALTPLPSTRDTLATLLWHDKAEAAAKNNLRTTLASLKRTIGEYLNTGPATVSFDHQRPYVSDVQLLQQRLNSAIDTQDVFGIADAVKLYQGEFLQGFHVRRAEPFDAWLGQQREELRLLTLNALQLGTQLCIQNRDLDRGLEMGRRHLAIDPWSEEAHRQVMYILAATGQTAQAIRQYEACAHLLLSEFALRPSEKTTILYNEIQSGKPIRLEREPVEQEAAANLPRTNSKRIPLVQAQNNIDATAIPHNLPALLPTFVGRQSEIPRIMQALSQPDYRLLSITGLGGIGKSTLAIQSGYSLLHTRPAQFPDGIYFVPLSGVAPCPPEAAGGGSLLRQIAQHIGCRLTPSSPVEKQLQEHLKSRRLLLILDNFEHLTCESTTVVTLLENAPHVKALTTSRIRLNVRGEAVVTLGKLSLPPLSSNSSSSANHHTPESLLPKVAPNQESDAVAMFIERAQLYEFDFELNEETRAHVYRICHLVEGLPLGIEMACSMLPLLSLSELAEGISETLDFLETDALDIPEEQRTLRAVFEKSWRLLALHEQKGLAALAIFPDTFHRNAAEHVAQLSKSMLKQLINQSLVERNRKERFSLHPSIREYALEKLLDLDELYGSTRLAYAEYYLRLLAQEEEGQVRAKHSDSTTKLQVDLHNIRFALRIAAEDGLLAALNESVHTLYLYNEQQGLYSAGVDDASYALQQMNAHEDALEKEHKEAPETRKSSLSREQLILTKGRLQTYLGWMRTRLGHLKLAEAAIQQAHTHLQDADNPNAMLLCLSIWVNIVRGDNPRRAKEICQEAKHLLSLANTQSGKALIYQRAADISFLLGDYQDAINECEQAIARAEKDQWRWGEAISHQTMGSVYRSLGRYSDAKEHFMAGLSIAQQHKLPAVDASLTLHLGGIARLQGNIDDAQKFYTEFRAISKQSQTDYNRSTILWEEGCMAEQRGEYARAKTLFLQSSDLPRHRGQWGHVMPTLGWALIGLGELEAARDYFNNVLSESQSKQLLPVSLEAEAGLLYIEELHDNPQQNSGEHPKGENPPNNSTRAKLKQILEHPATAHQTCNRIAALILS